MYKHSEIEDMFEAWGKDLLGARKHAAKAACHKLNEEVAVLRGALLIIQQSSAVSDGLKSAIQIVLGETEGGAG